MEEEEEEVVVVVVGVVEVSNPNKCAHFYEEKKREKGLTVLC